MPQDIQKYHDFEYVFLFIQCVHTGTLIPTIIFPLVLRSNSMWVCHRLVGKQVLKTSSSGTTGLWHWLNKQVHRQTNRQRGRQAKYS